MDCIRTKPGLVLIPVALAVAACGVIPRPAGATAVSPHPALQSVVLPLAQPPVGNAAT